MNSHDDAGARPRPTFEDLYMALAFGMAWRSTCRRLQVGTVITTTDYHQVLAVGYNGNAAGLRNGCDHPDPGACGCLHSEENACINCQAPRSQAKVVFVTHLPCAMCAKRLINLGGVERVLYASEYRRRDSLATLAQANIAIARLSSPIGELLAQAQWGTSRQHLGPEI